MRLTPKALRTSATLPRNHNSIKYCLVKVSDELHPSIMFLTVAIVKQVQTDEDYNRFYAKAEATLAQDVDYAELQLADAQFGVQAIPIRSAKAGINIFYMSGSGTAPLKEGQSITVVCFAKGEMP